MCWSLAEADIQPAPRIAALNDAIDDGESDTDLDMDYDEQRDLADQGPLTDMDLEEWIWKSSRL